MTERFASSSLLLFVNQEAALSLSGMLLRSDKKKRKNEGNLEPLPWTLFPAHVMEKSLLKRPFN